MKYVLAFWVWFLSMLKSFNNEYWDISIGYMIVDALDFKPMCQKLIRILDYHKAETLEDEHYREVLGISRIRIHIVAHRGVGSLHSSWQLSLNIYRR